VGLLLKHGVELNFDFSFQGLDLGHTSNMDLKSFTRCFVNISVL
jgi:hypothetical protein